MLDSLFNVLAFDIFVPVKVWGFSLGLGSFDVAELID